MKKGYDISHWNKILRYDLDADFVFLKATQGNRFVDPTYKKNVINLREEKIQIGHYHFADELKNEAKHFLETVEYKEGDIVALDYEIQLANPVDWCYNWLKIVEKKLGVKPLIYLNVATVNGYDWNKVIEAGYGLWIADYSSGEARIGQWEDWTIRQTSSRGTDKKIVGRVDTNLLKEKNMKTPTDKVLGWIKDNVYDFKNKINKREASVIIMELSHMKRGFMNDAKVKEMQSSLERMKASLNGYIIKNKELSEKIKIQDEMIERMKSVNSENAKNTKIIDALMYFLKSIISKLK